MVGSRSPFRAERYEIGRPARPHAAPALLEASLERFPPAEAPRMAEALAAIDPWRSYPYPAPGLARYFASGSEAAPIFAIRVGGDIAGLVGLRLDWLRGPYLQFLGILPAWHRQGLGGLVLDWLQREAGPGARNLWVCASDFNTSAIRFYERHGFARVAVLDGLVQDDRDEVLMRKRLSTHPG
jgi:ribosomal protein S18 acetylase RimI-like enzyme